MNVFPEVSGCRLLRPKRTPVHQEIWLLLLRPQVLTFQSLLFISRIFCSFSAAVSSKDAVDLSKHQPSQRENSSKKKSSSSSQPSETAAVKPATGSSLSDFTGESRPLFRRSTQQPANIRVALRCCNSAALAKRSSPSRCSTTFF